ncbi:MAG TPA: hypothetical protein VHF45_10885 [Thermoleophilaceae bacterium]|nr:hypothetical protein [Thermoleophilaceae bacterium]
MPLVLVLLGPRPALTGPPRLLALPRVERAVEAAVCTLVSALLHPCS